MQPQTKGAQKYCTCFGHIVVLVKLYMLNEIAHPYHNALSVQMYDLER